MLDLVGDLLSIDQYAMIVVIALSALGGFVMKQMVDSLALVALFVPVFLVGALVALYLFAQYDIVLAADKEANVVAVSAVGMMAGLVIMILITRVVSELGKGS